MARYVLVRHASADSTDPSAKLTERGRAEAEALAQRLGSWSFDAAWSSDLARAEQTATAILAGRESPPLGKSPLLREVEAPSGGLSLSADPEGYMAWENEVTERLAEKLTRWLKTAAGDTGGPSYDLPAPHQKATIKRKGEGIGMLPLPCKPRPLPSEEGIGMLPLRWKTAPPPKEEGTGVLPLPKEGCVTYRKVRTTLLVVSHAGPLRVLICLLLGLPPRTHWSFRLDCASLTVVDRGDDMGTLLLLNDRCHLEGLNTRRSL